MISNDKENIILEIQKITSRSNDIGEINNYFEEKTRIKNFITSKDDLNEILNLINEANKDNYLGIKKDLGDFQTPSSLTDAICKYICDCGFVPDVIIEPTCGSGNFIISSIKHFYDLKYIYCVDIQKKYEYLFKLNIYKLSKEQKINPKIEFYCDNIFSHRFSNDLLKYINSGGKRLLILGNPPWITNSKISILDSHNMPYKYNIKQMRGIEVITGKGDFDIAESIIIRLIKQFSCVNGKLAILCKTSVIKNIIRDISILNLDISDIKELLIDSKKEFNISADSALFLANFSGKRDKFCRVYSLYHPEKEMKRFGWINNKFVSDIYLYKKYGYIDGISPFEWRQGIKHDAEKVMVLKISPGGLKNGLGETVTLENDTIYPLIKGSHLPKNELIKEAKYKIIITQISPLNETNFIQYTYPYLWDYLMSHDEYFRKRKSVIYKNKPRFSIFGIGEYSFKPYKVGISGLNKIVKFSLILPIENKPVMLDDTCYFLSFDNIRDAFFTWILLNSEEVKNFLSSIVFLDSKRPYTKEILKRVDILKLLQITPYEKIANKCEEQINEFGFNEKDFVNYKNFILSNNKESDDLFRVITKY